MNTKHQDEQQTTLDTQSSGEHQTSTLDTHSETNEITYIPETQQEIQHETPIYQTPNLPEKYQHQIYMKHQTSKTTNNYLQKEKKYTNRNSKTT